MKQITKYTLAAIATLGIWKSPAFAQIAPICEGQLAREIETIRHNHSERASWGIFIETLSQQEIYRENARQYFIPASNAKLLTTAAALQRLGAEYRVRTSIYRTETGLHVTGRGDPSLTGESLAQLVRLIAETGLQQVDRLVLDDSYFGGEAINPNWDWEDVQAGYGAPVNSAILDRNEIPFILHPQGLGQPLRVEWERSIDRGRWNVENRSVTVAENAPEWLSVGRDLHSSTVRVSGQLIEGSPPEPVSVAVVNPTEQFLQQLQQALTTEGISIGESIAVTESIPVKGAEIAVLLSPTVGELVDRTNRVSDNLYAEVLLRWLGTTRADDGTSAARRGVFVVEEALRELGVDPASFALNDGSGLSRLNWVSPESLVQTLQGMARSPHARLYRNSLPVASESGTLQSRLSGSPYRVQAKTGTLTGVSALSGYLEHPRYGTLVFSIIVNNSDRSTTEQRRSIDEIVLLLTRLQPCQGYDETQSNNTHVETEDERTPTSRRLGAGTVS
ncbi:MAG: D-alanyl-D-alanine carboxypeptidase/D-alanyl-D-alanine-endopeptidase [Cyanobacteria bacterium SBC]|nr:D-alanyl-D-alanine carboxypeptidase/D-alanyl-D-alanine-endopeptidase [Cyanobacteria bacterium SBC]